VKNQHGIRAWLAVSKTQNLQKFGSLKFSLFWDSSSLDSKQEGRNLFFSRLGIAELFLGFC
jgi:hypothetical protein